MNAVLELDAAEIATGDFTLWPALSARAEGRRIALIGRFRPFFRVLAQQARIRAGVATLNGVPLDAALARGTVGLALCDPPLDGRLDVLSYLSLAARLSERAARSARDAERVARASLERLGLTELARLGLATLSKRQERALGCALATLGEPPVVCLETPLAGLDAVSADHVTALLERVAERHALVISLGELPALGPERCALDACDAALLFAGEAIVPFDPAQNEGLTFRVSALGDVKALQSALAELGCKLTEHEHTLSGGSVFGVELHEPQRAALLFEKARELGVTLLELEALPEPVRA